MLSTTQNYSCNNKSKWQSQLLKWTNSIYSKGASKQKSKSEITFKLQLGVGILTLLLTGSTHNLEQNFFI